MVYQQTALRVQSALQRHPIRDLQGGLAHGSAEQERGSLRLVQANFRRPSHIDPSHWHKSRMRLISIVLFAIYHPILQYLDAIKIIMAASHC